jgi:hypothetical protein
MIQGWTKKNGKEIRPVPLSKEQIEQRDAIKHAPISGQNNEYLTDVLKGLDIRAGSKNYIFSKNNSIVACPSPFDSSHTIIMGLKYPIKGVIIAQIVPDPTYPEFGKKPFGVFFPPNDSLNKSLITFEGIRIAFGMTIEQIFTYFKKGN